jgi:hypothetical protein
MLLSVFDEGLGPRFKPRTAHCKKPLEMLRISAFLGLYPSTPFQKNPPTIPVPFKPLFVGDVDLMKGKPGCKNDSNVNTDPLAFPL